MPSTGITFCLLTSLLLSFEINLEIIQIQILNVI